MIGIIAFFLALFTPIPLPLWLTGLWFLLVVLVILHPWPRAWTKLPYSARFAIFASCSAACVAHELPHYFLPHIGLPRGATVYVVGDSLSAGVGSSEQPWPAVLGEQSGLRVINLAVPGATLASGLAQIKQIAAPAELVVVELGGNDLLSFDFDSFAGDLEMLLRELKGTSQRLLMFELPLPPFCAGLGRTQRALALKYGVTLLPKTCLTRALGGDAGTLDGLHLSQSGHNKLAQALQESLE